MSPSQQTEVNEKMHDHNALTSAYKFESVPRYTDHTGAVGGSQVRTMLQDLITCHLSC